MLIGLEDKYKPAPEGSEIPEGQRALETLKKTLHGVVHSLYNISLRRREALKTAMGYQEDEIRYERQIGELKKSIDVLSQPWI